ncbi:hypothetical protein PoB_002120900 [Plakobranchus ocellatus]|uniref:Uncharacterized protein n=1 Tax=Plakobranchus ocellatus TaxID=259542 RepID=A0AAV3ZLF4_9GAST|nr:hypothetical protein PoB_002120900 [Plakobranchus ocellatus]
MAIFIALLKMRYHCAGPIKSVDFKISRGLRNFRKIKLQDFDDSTCIGIFRSFTITVKESIAFTWLRLVGNDAERLSTIKISECSSCRRVKNHDENADIYYNGNENDIDRNDDDDDDDDDDDEDDDDDVDDDDDDNDDEKQEEEEEEGEEEQEKQEEEEEKEEKDDDDDDDDDDNHYHHHHQQQQQQHHYHYHTFLKLHIHFNGEK